MNNYLPGKNDCPAGDGRKKKVVKVVTTEEQVYRETRTNTFRIFQPYYMLCLDLTSMPIRMMLGKRNGLGKRLRGS